MLDKFDKILNIIIEIDIWEISVLEILDRAEKSWFGKSCFKFFFRFICLFLVLVLLMPSLSVFAQPSSYRSEDEIIQDFFDLQSSYPDLLSNEVIGQTVQGKDIYVFKLGNPEGVRVFIDASMHGHEYITSEALYYCVEWLILEREDILTENYILFVPVLNRDCYQVSRVNAAGVDLNRNFPTYWEYGGYGTIYYTGPFALSEPETQAIHNALGSISPRWYINLHAGYEETRITPPSIQPIYSEVYDQIFDTSLNVFGVSPFPYDTYQFYEGMARYEGEAQGAYTWEIEISECNPSLDYFFGTVVPRLKAVFVETFLEGVEIEPNQIPEAVVNGPYSGVEDAVLTFSAVGSFDPDGDLLTYRWDFGDGTTLVSDTEVVTHTYSSGLLDETVVYPVSLVVNDGQADSTAALTSASIIGVNDAPIAQNNGPYFGFVGDVIVFDAAGSSDEEGIVSYLWDFGDGEGGLGETITHSYEVAGIYEVYLTIQDTNQATSTVVSYAEIIEAPLEPSVYCSIDMTREDAARGKTRVASRAVAEVSVSLDSVPLKKATVHGSWSGALDMIVVGSTNREGKVIFRSSFIENADAFVFTINEIEKDGVSYLIEGEQSDSI